jgi:hypothetical protein
MMRIAQAIFLHTIGVLAVYNTSRRKILAVRVYFPIRRRSVAVGPAS